MKFYDKELCKVSEEISTIIFILEINKLQNIINIQHVELESFKDAQYMKKYLNLEENKK